MVLPKLRRMGARNLAGNGGGSMTADQFHDSIVDLVCQYLKAHEHDTAEAEQEALANLVAGIISLTVTVVVLSEIDVGEYIKLLRMAVASQQAEQCGAVLIH
jgi:uncharacterized protein YbjQ (UPF0145 family)